MTPKAWMILCLSRSERLNSKRSCLTFTVIRIATIQGSHYLQRNKSSSILLLANCTCHQSTSCPCSTRKQLRLPCDRSKLNCGHQLFRSASTINTVIGEPCRARSIAVVFSLVPDFFGTSAEVLIYILVLPYGLQYGSSAPTNYVCAHCEGRLKT